jgi:Ca2+:H+ antiporter
MTNLGLELETSSSKQHNLEANSIPVSTVAFVPGCKFRCAFEKIVESVKIVIFGAKINVLLPFGPASIILHYLTNHHVSVIICCPI